MTTRPRRFSEHFRSYFQGNECRCGRAKRNYFALCGICYMALGDDMKTELRTARGFGLEIAFNSAAAVINNDRRLRRRRKRIVAKDLEFAARHTE